MVWQEQFEMALETYKAPLFLLTAATFAILLAKLFTDASVALSITIAFFMLGAAALLAAGVSAAYSIVRYA